MPVIPCYDHPVRTASGLGCAVAPGSILATSEPPHPPPQITQRLDALRSRAIDVRDDVNRLQVRLTSVSRPQEKTPGDKIQQHATPPNDVPVASAITEVILILLETKETVTRILEHLEVP